MLTTIAVDDEPVALDIIRKHAARVSFIDLKETFVSAAEALKYLKDEQIQVIFLDIQMPDLSGLEFAATVGEGSQIIFTTAYSEYALNGFDLAVTDYLLKPINFNRFLQACDLAAQRSVAVSPKTDQINNGLFIKDGYTWVRINFDDLLYVEAHDNYVKFNEAQKSYVTRMTLTNLLTRIPNDTFIRVHKSFIVALPKIEKVEAHHLFISGRKIPVSRSYRDQLLRKLIK